ncbi:B-cell receptor-associated protein 31-like-domain-containing protein [Russula earlei]|uniref:B-cell receptor-associated protein 31-like-domain-containing protein n=1 Tax=Russula earlei TaxID=71964 RepID=A0ACC0UHW8_9AGAM|nr:B-cell receptor-associated protein 31-like-domain-containing protein [Russula earlei]
MTIYYSLTFALLASEMFTFCIFVAPLPFKIRRKLFRFLSESQTVAKVAYGLKISFIFVGVLFVDAVQRMFRITTEVEAAKSIGQGIQDVRAETSIAARKFYAQRNVYLTGFCLFLSLVLTRTFLIIQDLIHLQDEYAKLKKATADNSRNNVLAGDQTREIERLKKDLEALKEQARSQAKEYDRLADQYNKETSQPISDKRSD